MLRPWRWYSLSPLYFLSLLLEIPKDRRLHDLGKTREKRFESYR